MDSVRDHRRAAWAALRRGPLPVHEASLGAVKPRKPWEGSMLDLLFIALTIVAFGVLWLLVKGVERFER
jgi:hypothetical protein